MQETATAPERLKPPQYGQDIIEPGEPFTDATLDTIRALLAESDPVPQPKPLEETVLFAGRRGKRDKNRDTTQPEIHCHDPVVEPQAPSPFPDLAAPEEEPFEIERSWRTIEVTEGSAGRSLRRFLMSPRLVAVVFLAGVVAWQPWFIPMLALMIVSSLLLVGALIGQDRMARIVLFMLKRFVWADPSLGRVMQRILPQRWHPVLYRPTTADPAFDGPIDPGFAARLDRIKS
ncbi:hypothetical protein [uncultured Shimia sp.]|uniref:hypothetical protein n=1 Tax=uncultured Shimia sp. TaxID=573152 RepID=UPI002607E0C6|nr:hypothetical protein [uncultured Shimia sp.]